ncbi:GNAT family N-acetyltransferase [Paenibacillus allorhizosphaerae]|uniref:N-acetyltransferase domain-containing protein n=1 Tax=Paenibacillus allorhizosphaerae TaxID=2849866 RepID=A0ABN7TNW6_9BACL|nr:GNAT family N-acetyltransferase [Paenibacillus allorhizosphaerae]CAG7637307.1 hypothetical protein PAECIP111802_02344 [Paenibacillus allorhizosphaerae]
MATIPIIEKILSTGEHVVIRSAAPADALNAYHIQRSVVDENEFVITQPHELRNSEESYRGLIDKISRSEKELFIVAEVNGEVAGWLVFHTPSLQRRAHYGEFGMMLFRQWRGKGIGKLLISAMLGWAESHPVIEKVGLEVFSTNEHAIRLYQGFGFLEEGRRMRQIKLGSGSYIDLILMYRMVSE